MIQRGDSSSKFSVSVDPAQVRRRDCRVKAFRDLSYNHGEISVCMVGLPVRKSPGGAAGAKISWCDFSVDYLH